MRYLPVQSGLVAIKRVHHNEESTVVFVQIFHVFTFRVIVFQHLHDGHRL